MIGGIAIWRRTLRPRRSSMLTNCRSHRR